MPKKPKGKQAGSPASKGSAAGSAAAAKRATAGGKSPASESRAGAGGNSASEARVASAESTRAKADAGHRALEPLIHHDSPEVLKSAAADPRLSSDLALALLERRELPQAVLEALSKNSNAMKSREVKHAVVRHPRTPRHVSLPLARHLYSSELMQIALTAGIAPDIKMACEELIIGRLESVSSGERLTLAKRGSARVAAALLMDPERRVIEAAMVNPYMTETSIVNGLMNRKAPQDFIDAVCRDGRWSTRQEVKVALLRNPNTPFARVLAISEAMSTHQLKDILSNALLAPNVKSYMLGLIERREQRGSIAGQQAAR